MEMDPEKLDLDRLPDLEKAFIGGLQQAALVMYSTGFAAEQALQILMAVHYQHLAGFENIALLRTGSGGRYDGAGLGDGDLILLTVARTTREGYPLEYLDTLLDTLRAPALVGAQTWTPIDVEHKPLDGPALLSAYDGKPERLYPDRMLEAEFLVGNASLWTAARERVFQEVRDEPRILKALRDRQRDHAKVCERGWQMRRGEKLVHFDRSTGEIFYDPGRDVFGLKHSFMRYVQNALTLDILGFVNRRGIPISEVSDLNQSVEERIRYVLRKGWVPEDRAWQLIEYGIGYAKACELNSQLKARYYTHGSTSVRVGAEVLPTMYELFVGEGKKGFLPP